MVINEIKPWYERTLPNGFASDDSKNTECMIAEILELREALDAEKNSIINTEIEKLQCKLFFAREGTQIAEELSEEVINLKMEVKNLRKENDILIKSEIESRIIISNLRKTLAVCKDVVLNNTEESARKTRNVILAAGIESEVVFAITNTVDREISYRDNYYKLINKLNCLNKENNDLSTEAMKLRAELKLLRSQKMWLPRTKRPPVLAEEHRIPPPPPAFKAYQRKIVQLCSTDTLLLALCNDSTVWVIGPDGGNWTKVKKIPQDD